MSPRYDYIVAYSGTVSADTAEEAERAAEDSHLLLADVTVTVTEKGTDDRDA